MPRERYKRKSNRSSWTEENMQRALKAIKDKVTSIRNAARMFNVPYGTLQDRIRGKFDAKKYTLGRKSVFTTEQESELTSHIISMSKLFYGLSPQSIRQLAYQYAEENRIIHKFNQEKKMAGKDWLYLFMRRNPTISFRKPEATSISRVLAFNRVEVNIFFDNLEQIYEKYKFEAHRIFNVDETGISNVHVPSRIAAPKGQKQVGAITSGERGQLVTVVTTMSAAGHYVPPMFIFKRERMKEGLQKNGPTGAIYKCSKSGWITEELFTEWIRYFAAYTKSSKDDPVLLVLDNHSTHSNLSTYNFCRENGIVVISLPPHTSHRLQPLDVCFFGPLKMAYNQECDRYIKSKQLEKILQTDIAELFKNAFNRVATVEKGVRGFEVTGIFPFNRFVFTEEELTPIPDGEEHITAEISEVEHVDLPIQRSERTPSPLAGPSTSNYQAPPRMIQKKRNRESSPSSDSDDTDMVLEEVVEDELSDDTDKTLQPTQKNKSFTDLLPLPKQKTRSMSRRAQHSKIMTSTPLKDELEKKEERKKERLKDVQRVKKNVIPGRKHKKKNTADYEKCTVCDGFGGKNDLWWRCRSCGSWAHADCTDIEQAKDYECEKCLDY